MRIYRKARELTPAAWLIAATTLVVYFLSVYLVFGWVLLNDPLHVGLPIGLLLAILLFALLVILKDLPLSSSVISTGLRAAAVAIIVLTIALAAFIVCAFVFVFLTVDFDDMGSLDALYAALHSPWPADIIRAAG